MTLALRPEAYAQALIKLSVEKKTQRPRQWQQTLEALSSNILGLYLWQSTTEGADENALDLFKQRAHFKFLRRTSVPLVTLDFYRRHWINSVEANVTFSRTLLDSSAHLPKVEATSIAPVLSYVNLVWRRHSQLLQRPFLRDRAADDRQLLKQLARLEPHLKAILIGAGQTSASMRTLEDAVLTFLKQAVDRVIRWQVDEGAALAMRHMDAALATVNKPLSFVRKLIIRHLQLLLAHLSETQMIASAHYDFLNRKQWSLDRLLGSVDADANEKFYDFLEVYLLASQRAPDRRAKSYLLYVSPTTVTTYDDIVTDPVLNRRLQGDERTPFTLSSSWVCVDSVEEVYNTLGSSHRNLLYVIELTAKGRQLAPVFSTSATTLILLPGTQLTVNNMRVMYHPRASAVLLDESQAGREFMIVLYCQITGSSLPEDVDSVLRFHEQQHVIQTESVLQALTSQYPPLQKTLTATALDGTASALWHGINTDAVCISKRGVEARQALLPDTQLGIVHGEVMAWPQPRNADDRRVAVFSFTTMPPKPTFTLYVDITAHLTGHARHQWTWPSTRDAKRTPDWVTFFANTALVKRPINSISAGEHFVWVTTRAVPAHEELTMDHSAMLFHKNQRQVLEWNLYNAPLSLTSKLVTDSDLRSLADRSLLVYSGVK